MTKIFVFCILFIASGVSIADDLTGRWRGSDGGIYYLSQVGDRIYWYGQDSRRRPVWSNVFTGRLRGRNIRGHWSDVPKGHTQGHGRLELQIRRRGGVLRVTYQTGGFSASRLRRIRGPRSDQYYQDNSDYDFNPQYDRFDAEPDGGGGYDGLRDATTSKNECFRFNPRRLTLRKINGHWLLVSGNYFLEDFGRHRRRASQALSIVRHYRMNEFCSVGGPGSDFRFLLSSGRSPQGRFTNEYCADFRRNRLRMRRFGRNWKVGDDSFWLFEFSNRSDANHALQLLRKHRFRYACYVGDPPERHFRYLRR